MARKRQILSILWAQLVQMPETVVFLFLRRVSDPQLRDRHEGKHQRPFYCTFTGCHKAEFGCRSKRELNKHMADFHPKVHDSDSTFPDIRERKQKDIFKAAEIGD